MIMLLVLQIKEFINSYESHSKRNTEILTNTNEYIIQRHFFLETIKDVNDALLRNNAGFVFDVSDELYHYFEEKIVDNITLTSKRTYKEVLYQISLHRRYMPNNKLLVNLKESNNDIHVFLLKKYWHSVIMISALIAISILKQSSMSEKQLTKFLFYLSQEALKEYLANAEIYKGKKRLTKNELIETIITEKPITITHFNKDEEMTK